MNRATLDLDRKNSLSTRQRGDAMEKAAVQIAPCASSGATRDIVQLLKVDSMMTF